MNEYFSLFKFTSYFYYQISKFIIEILKIIMEHFNLII